MKKIPLAIATKSIKCLGINLKKEVNNLYTKNYKTIREIEEGTKRWKER